MKVLKNATIMPLEGSMDAFSGGVFSSDGQFINDSIIEYRGTHPQWKEATVQLDGVYLYGGCLFSHFGHYIWESLSRLYTIRECEKYSVLFISPRSENPNVLKRFFRAIDIRNEILIVSQPIRIETLIYSSPGSSLRPLYVTDEQIAALQYFSFSPNTKSKKKIWLSRSKLPHGKVLNEEFIEIRLMKLGFEIVHFEELPFREQVRLISTADVVAGFCGSAFYSALFAKEIKGKFILFDRGRGFQSEYSYIFEKRGIDYSLYSFDLELAHECTCGSAAGNDYMHKEWKKIIEVLE